MKRSQVVWLVVWMVGALMPAGAWAADAARAWMTADAQWQVGQPARVYVHADNTGLGGQKTTGAGWALPVPAGLQFVSSGFPDDSVFFFAGFDLWAEGCHIADTLTAEGVLNDNYILTDITPQGHGPDYGPANTIGQLAWYEFIPTQPGDYALNLMEFVMVDTSGNGQLVNVEGPLSIHVNVPEPAMGALAALLATTLLARRRATGG